ncbi:GNAT family N-acetyltransferase [Streptomyces sp. SID12501]|uniref:GNAT family N-acetyltransferase n=1 Tax=Streptomyces sp. SID12501 TaxID=2706042 RepID=A0A6B3BLC0_9ACTN|nr:GNAT family N-acetyltransferase [Streptomyces sp. SID12501]NEC84909.1 GNAT family N-acetyltransferase [Streptomyces sp. SID12501]
MTYESTARPAVPAPLWLPGEGLVLREWTEADLPAMTDLFDDPGIAHWTPLASPFDLAAARAYLATARQARLDGLRVQLAITTDGQLPLGEVLVIRRNANDRTASLGYSVGATHRGRHLGSRALTVLTDYAHHTLGLPRVTLSIEAENGASAAVARAAGYHLTDEPPILTVDKGRSLALRTWAHDRP